MARPRSADDCSDACPCRLPRLRHGARCPCGISDLGEPCAYCTTYLVGRPISKKHTTEQEELAEIDARLEKAREAGREFMRSRLPVSPDKQQEKPVRRKRRTRAEMIAVRAARAAAIEAATPDWLKENQDETLEAAMRSGETA